MIAHPQPESNDLAIASLVLGVLSHAGLGPLTGVPAIITGWMALRKNQTNKGMAVAGVITGAVSIVLAILVVLFFVLLILLGVFAAGSYEASPDSYDDPGAPSGSSQYQQRA